VIRARVCRASPTASSDHPASDVSGIVTSSVAELDALLGGGLHRGTSALFIGPSGVGKSITATQYVRAAAERGELGAVYVFDESTTTYLARAEGLGLDLRPHVASGRVRLRQLAPAQLSPGEFD
jgi:circadian clock protein KaiC